MTSRFLLLSFAVACASCGAETATQPRDASLQAPLETSGRSTEPGRKTIVPPNRGDRLIRRELNLAIYRDADLKDRDISFIVINGDVRVTGIVRTEAERGRIIDLAMGIAGVKSVANALRVAE